MTYYMEAWHGDLPPSLKFLFQYAGRSSINQASGAKGGFENVGKFGGGINDKASRTPTGARRRARRRSSPRCATWATRRRRQDRGSSSTTSPSRRSAAAELVRLRRPTARRCTRATRSCTCSTAASTAATPSPSSTISATPSCTSPATPATRSRSASARPSGSRASRRSRAAGRSSSPSATRSPPGGARRFERLHRGLDFGGKVLTYSIIRDSAFFAEIETIPELPEDEQDKLLKKYKLKRVAAPTVTASAGAPDGASAPA